MSETNGHHEKKRLTNPPEMIEFKIQRREKLDAEAYWETFEIPYRRNLNVISALMFLQPNFILAGPTTGPGPFWWPAHQDRPIRTAGTKPGGWT